MHPWIPQPCWLQRHCRLTVTPLSPQPGSPSAASLRSASGAAGGPGRAAAVTATGALLPPPRGWAGDAAARPGLCPTGPGGCGRRGRGRHRGRPEGGAAGRGTAGPAGGEWAPGGAAPAGACPRPGAAPRRWGARWGCGPGREAATNARHSRGLGLPGSCFPGPCLCKPRSPGCRGPLHPPFVLRGFDLGKRGLAASCLLLILKV